MPWADREQRLEYHKRYYEKNKHKGLWNKARKDWSPERRKQHFTYMRDYILKRNYGISLEDYKSMIEAQGGKCAICKLPPRNKVGLHVDHCHETGKIRRLLCAKCNMALGWLEKHKVVIQKYLDGNYETD